MKFVLTVVIASLFSFGLSFNVDAQILNRLKKKAQEAAAQKAEEKLTEQVQQAAEQMVEKSWNSIFGEFESDSSSFGKLPFKMNSNVKTEDEYRFTIKSTMEITSVNEDGSTEPPVLMHMFFNEDEVYTGSQFESEEMKKEDGELFIIYDFKNSAMLMLMSNDSDKFSFAYDWNQTLESVQTASDSIDTETDEISSEDWDNYEKIGSKTILGYSCDGYRSENDQQITEVWVSKDADFGMTNLFQAHANAKQLKNKMPADYPQGMLMEMSFKDLSNNEETRMKVINIDKNNRTKLVMSDYPTMSFAMKSNQEK